MVNKILVAAVIFIILGVGLAGFINGYSFNDHETSPQVTVLKNTVTKTIPLIAVDSSGVGAVSQLTVEVGPGKGRILVNINDVLANTDTQQSARNAVLAAENYLNVKLDNVDIIFSIESDAEVVAGESAGSAMTIALIMALENKEMKDGVAITGTISADGAIGPVGGLLAKSQAVKSYGNNTFLVPEGQATQYIESTAENCKLISQFQLCEVSRGYEPVNLGQYSKLEVVEVNNIEDALTYFQFSAQV